MQFQAFFLVPKWNFVSWGRYRDIFTRKILDVSVYRAESRPNFKVSLENANYLLVLELLKQLENANYVYYNLVQF